MTTFIGRTRFSLYQPGAASWRLSSRDSAAGGTYLEQLYEPQRMRNRLDLLLGFVLPQIESSRDGHRVRHIVSYSDRMPAWVLDELRAGVGAYSWVQLDCHSDGAIEWPLGRMAQLLLPSGGVFGSYRLDDDDLVSSDYFDQMSRYITSANVGTRVSLGLGAAAVYEDGTLVSVREIYQPMNSIGLLDVAEWQPASGLRTAPDAPHVLSDRYGPVILDSRRHSFIQTRHLGQDTYGQDDDVQPKQGVSDLVRGLPDFPEAVSLESRFTAVGALISRLGSPKAREIVDQREAVELSAGEFLANFPGTVHVRLGLEIVSLSVAEPRAALLSVDLRCADGSAFDGSIEGWHRSPNTDIGVFRYVAASLTARQYWWDLVLPTGVMVFGVRIQAWSEKTVGVQLNWVRLAGEPLGPDLTLTGVGD